MQETPNEILKLPERGRLLVRQIESQLSTGDWDLTEKALLALKALAQMPGGSELMQVRGTSGLAHILKAARKKGGVSGCVEVCTSRHIFVKEESSGRKRWVLSHSAPWSSFICIVPTVSQQTAWTPESIPTTLRNA